MLIDVKAPGAGLCHSALGLLGLLVRFLLHLLPGVVLKLDADTLHLRFDRLAGIIRKARTALGDGGILRSIIQAICDLGHLKSPLTVNGEHPLLFGDLQKIA